MCGSEEDNQCTDLVNKLNKEMGELIDCCKELADATGEMIEIRITAIPKHKARFTVQRRRGVIR